MKSTLNDRVTHTVPENWVLIHKSSLKNHTVKLGDVKLLEMIHIQHNSLGFQENPGCHFIWIKSGKT